MFATRSPPPIQRRRGNRISNIRGRRAENSAGSVHDRPAARTRVFPDELGPPDPGSDLPRRGCPGPTKNGVTLLCWRCDARQRSYWACMPIHSSGLVPRASDSFSAMSAEIPALPFKMRDSATRVTPRCLAASVTDLVPRYSRRTLPGCGGLCMRIKTSQ
jgi:hypothetical protein